MSASIGYGTCNCIHPIIEVGSVCAAELGRAALALLQPDGRLVFTYEAERAIRDALAMEGFLGVEQRAHPTGEGEGS